MCLVCCCWARTVPLKYKHCSEAIWQARTAKGLFVQELWKNREINKLYSSQNQ